MTQNPIIGGPWQDFSGPAALRASLQYEERMRASQNNNPRNLHRRASEPSHSIKIPRQSQDGKRSQLSERVQSLELIFRDLAFMVTKNRGKKDEETKVILNHLYGMFKPGRLTAIMGPSGAGKTSLLDVLAGNLLGGEISGQVLVNGEDYTGKKIKEISGFVFQDDVLLETMTVSEAIKQSALLRLPKSVSKEEKSRRVEDILSLLNLQRCRNTKIGSPLKKGISGGERKRACIAMELIANPPMLFLDEPTSGLDTFTAYTVIRSLSRLAKQGRTVIATIHQPSSEIFHLFDDLLLLSEGNIVYMGSAEDSIKYFAKLGFPCPKYSNPADFYFMEVLRQFELEGLSEIRRKLNPSLAREMEEKEALLGAERESESGSESESGPGRKSDSSLGEGEKANAPTKKRLVMLTSSWNESEERKKMMSDMDNGNKDGVSITTLRKMAPLYVQFKFLLGRASKNALRNPMIVTVQLFKSIFLGVLVGLVYLDSNRYSVPVQIRNKSGAIYFLALNQFFGTTFGVLTVFYTEKQVFFREYKAGYYTTTPYFLSKFLVELPYNFIFPYLMVLIAYYMVGLNPPFSDYLYSATFVAIASLAGLSLGMLIASIFDDLEVILAVTPAILLPLLLLSGIFISGASIPVFLIWIKYISPIYYSSVGMLQVEFSRDFPNCNPSAGSCSGRAGLDAVGFTNVLPSGVNMALEIALWLAFSIAAYLVLCLVTRLRYQSL